MPECIPNSNEINIWVQEEKGEHKRKEKYSVGED